MVKLAARQVEGFLKSPDASVQAVLVYGPDTGLVRERVDTLTKFAAGDPPDPFNVVDLPGDVLRKDPALLADEAAAISMVGGRRAVRILNAGDSLTKVFSGFAEHPSGDALIILEAGELGPRSSLRKLFEKETNFAAVPCYADDGRSLGQVITETLGAAGLSIEPDARSYLIEQLGADRRLTRSELDKIVLFKGDETVVSLADAKACTGGNSGFSLDTVAQTAANGDQKGLENALSRALDEGNQPITVLRSVSRHFQRLHLVSGYLSEGVGLEQAMKKLRPPLFFKVADAFKAQVQKWPPHKLEAALGYLTEAELDCKITGYPADAICGRALMRIAQAARSR